MLKVGRLTAYNLSSLSEKEERHLLGCDAMWHRIPEDGIHHSHCHENFKSYMNRKNVIKL
jgi:hypothetical protein